MSSRIRNKINSAIKADNDLMETEIQSIEEATREKIRKQVIKHKVRYLLQLEKGEEQIKENILIGQKLTQECLNKK